MSRKYNSRIDEPQSPADTYDGTELMPLGKNPSANVEQPHDSAPASTQESKDNLSNPQKALQDNTILTNKTAFFIAQPQIFNLLTHIVRGEQEKAEDIIKEHPKLLLESAEAITHSRGVRPEDKFVVLKGTAFQLAACVMEDAEMAAMIDKYLAPNEKSKQVQEWSTAHHKEEKEIAAESAADLKALDDILGVIRDATPETCKQLRVPQEQEAAIATSDNEAAKNLLHALNTFRDYINPKEVITSKQFKMELFLTLLDRYKQNYADFGGHWSSQKNLLCWGKLLGLMARYVPPHLGQGLAQDLYYLVEAPEGQREKLRRNFNLRYSIGCFYPLDLDPNFRMGIDYLGWEMTEGRNVELDWLKKLYQTNLAELQKIMQVPSNRTTNKCCVM